MATDIRLKKSSVAGRIPDSSNLDYGELALNYQDGKLYYKSAGGGVNAFLDSAGVDALIASKQGLDSAGATTLIEATVDSDYVLNRSSGAFPILNEDSSLSHYQKISFSVLTDAGGVVVLQPQVTYQDSGGDDVLANINLSKGDFSDSAAVINVIDSAYIQARQVDIDTVRDSNFVFGLIDSAYIQLRQVDTDTDTVRDSAWVYTVVDSAQVQARVTFPVDQVGLDSTQTTNLIDSAYVQARQIVGEDRFDQGL